MDKLMQILKDIKEDVDFDNSHNLIDLGCLDSFDIIRIVGEIMKAYDIKIPAAEIIPNNFQSVETMWKMIQKLQ